ncbi:helix-turn-helix domain-containing protein [Euzebya tangerina]|uniref:helix-turn-helix domain-containing protein n=1 Tax=Euzebya tangerina TaxID=591198 RepID=UPI0013C37ACB|nr:helix-turn-helix domain-containing protein [Euzebya tangerina]
MVQFPAPRLRPYVDQYVGYRVSGLQPGIHAGLPSRSLTMIVAFDEPLHVSSARTGSDRFWGMVAGLHDAPSSVHHHGSMHGIQLSLTPRGALALFDASPAELSSTHVHLGDIVPAIAQGLVDRLGSAPSWAERWVVLDEVLGTMIDDSITIPDPLDAAWTLLSETDGSARITDIADHVGWDRRRLSQRFRGMFGLTPKLAARVMRFERAQRLLASPRRPDLASVAAICGYADQAHMTREWNQFAGAPPATWLASEDVSIS